MMINPWRRILPLFWALTVVGAVQAQPPLVAVDVGHGGRDRGAISARGRDEFAFNLDFARVLAEQLQAHALAVREINFDETVSSLAERPRLAAGSDFFISIHHDSISEDYLQTWEWAGSELTYTEVKRGFGLFISAANPRPEESLACARAIGQRLRAAGWVPTPWHGRKHLAADAELGIWYYDNLVVLYRTSLPAVLFEAGVIKHREEELALSDPLQQTAMAAALAAGLAACLPLRE